MPNMRKPTLEICPDKRTDYWITWFNIRCNLFPGTSLFPYISGILAAILPYLSYGAEDAARKDRSDLEYKRIGVMSKVPSINDITPKGGKGYS